ncbi:hypothetical protein HDV05_004713 [Chytridiales sp. JEL 0842]|nr:hypothetical protein HDV05_004713 [Chytridiales sp. JEL 0842]
MAPFPLPYAADVDTPPLFQCVASYVRDKILSKETREEMVRNLKTGDPYVVEERVGVLVMVDISGYSTLFSNLTKLGKISSEIVTNTVGDFMSKIIGLIASYGGDIIKFLGDAVIVSYLKRHGETDSMLVERATACCINIISKYSLIDIFLDQAIEEQRRLGESSEYPSGPRKKPASYKKSITNVTDDDDPCTSIAKHIQLTIHVAITAGPITHTIFGNIEERLDYVAYGDCLQNLGEVLDSAKGGELGIDKSVFEYSSYIGGRFPPRSVKEGPGYIVLSRDTLIDLLKGMTQVHAAIQDSRATDDEDSLEKSYDKPLNVESLLPNTVRHEDMSQNTRPLEQDKTPPTYREPDVELLFTKFVNKSLVRKLKAASTKPIGRHPTLTRSNTSSCIVADEFRTVTIVFVKICASFSPRIAQQFMSKFAETLKKYEGVFQQYSVDDKGDVVNLSARLLGIPSPSSVIRCDKATFIAAREDFNFIDLGAHKVKGKSEPINVWSALAKSEEGPDRKKSNEADIVGYIKEKGEIFDFIRVWSTEGGQARLVIEGKSGMGKSKLIDYVEHQIVNHGMTFCLTQGTDITQFTPYSGIQNIMQFILRRHLNLSDVNEADGRHSNILSVRSGESGSVVNSPSYSSVGRIASLQSLRRMSLRRASKTLGQNPINAIIDNNSVTFRRFLETMGENPNIAPLFSAVLPIALEESPFTRNIDSQTRGALLKSAIVRIFNRSLAISKFALILDDTQWIDAPSLDILHAIIKSGADGCFMFLSRPLDEIKSDFLPKLLKVERTTHLVLSGFSMEDTEEVLLSKFNSMGIKKIHRDVVSTLYEKSEGVPLALDTIVETAKTQFDKVFHIVDDILEFSGLDGKAQISVMSTMEVSTMMQFDRLDPSFQNILKKASIVGKYFSLHDLAIFLPEMTTEEMESVINHNDVHSFLVKQNSNEDEDTNDTLTYCFRHLQLVNIIYQSQSFAERSECHEFAASAYEENLTSLNRDFLLPKVAYNYLKTSRYDKKIKYLEELGFRNFDAAHFIEAVNSFETLLQVARTSKVEIDNLRRAIWIGKLGHAHIETKSFQVKHLAIESLALLNRPWPSDPMVVKKSLKKSLFTFLKLWFRTKGGTRPPQTILDKLLRQRKVSPQKKASHEFAVRDALLLSYGILFKVAVYGGTLTEQENGLALFSVLCELIQIGHEKKVEWAGYSYIAVFGMSWLAPVLAQTVFENAMKVEKAIENKEPLHAYLHMAGLRHFQLANLEEAELPLLKNAEYYITRGDWSQGEMAMAIIQGVYFLQGRFHYRESEFLDALKEDSPHHTNINSALLRSSLITKNHEESRRRLCMTEASYKTLVVRPVYETYITFPQSWMAFQENDLDMALEKFHRTALLCVELKQYLQSIVTNILFMSLQGWMLVQPFVPDVEMKSVYVWNKAQTEKLLESLACLKTVCQRFAVKFRMPVFEWAFILYAAAELFTAGKKNKAIALILRSMKTKKASALLSKIKFFQAVVYSALGLHYFIEAERHMYCRKAKDLFVDFGADYLEAWLEQTSVAMALAR